MIVYLDNGTLIGWYYRSDDYFLGDGSRERAEEIKREREYLESITEWI